MWPWGWLFGLIWWYLGPMTLLPLMLTGVCDIRQCLEADEQDLKHEKGDE